MKRAILAFLIAVFITYLTGNITRSSWMNMHGEHWKCGFPVETKSVDTHVPGRGIEDSVDCNYVGIAINFALYLSLTVFGMAIYNVRKYGKTWV